MALTEKEIAGPFANDDAGRSNWCEAVRTPMDPSKVYTTEIELEGPRTDAEGCQHAGVDVHFPLDTYPAKRVRVTLVGRQASVTFLGSDGQEYILGFALLPLHERE